MTTWSASTDAPWLKVDSPAVPLSGGGSQKLTLTATPGTMPLSSTPYTADVTLTAAIPLPHSASTMNAKATVQLVIIAGLKLSNIGPAAGVDLETETDIRSGATITYTLPTGLSADVGLEVVDAANPTRAPFGTASQHVSNTGTFNLDVVIPNFQIPKDVTMARLRAFMRPANGTTLTANGNDYAVYPRAKLSIVANVTELWGGVDLDKLKTGLNCMADAPSRTKVSIQLLSNGSPIASDIVQTLSRNQTFYSAIFGNPALPAGAGTIQVKAVLAGGPTMDDITVIQPISVLAAPTISKFELGTGSGNTDFNADRSQLYVPSGGKVTDKNGGKPAARVTFDYSGSDLTAALLSAHITDAAQNHSFQASVSGPLQPGSSAIILPLKEYGYHEDSALLYSVTLENSAGQTVVSSSSASIDVVRFRLVTSTPKDKTTLQSGSQLPDFVVTIDYAVGPAGPARADGHLQLRSGQFYALPVAQQACATNLSAGASGQFTCTLSAAGAKVGDFGSYSLDFDLTSLSSSAILGRDSASFQTSASASLPAGLTFPVPLGGTTITPVTNTSDRDETSSTENVDIGTETVLEASGASNRSGNPRFASGTPSAGTILAPGSFAGIPLTHRFDPPIPEDGSFIAGMTMQYSPELLPDLPGYTEDKLQLISFDPATGRFVTYPSTVDTAAKTVTATIGGLAPYYSLAVPLSGLGSILNLPVQAASADFPAMLSFYNSGSDTASVTVVPHVSDGPIADPLALGLAPGQQGASSFPDGWVEAKSVSGLVRGAALIASGNGLESLPLTAGSAVDLLTGVVSNDAASTTLHIVNATPFDNSVTLDLHDNTGAAIDQAVIPLGPKAGVSGGVIGLFPNASRPFEGYVIAHGTQRISTASTTVVDRALTALPGRPLDLTAAPPAKLYAPYFETGGGVSSTLVTLVNPTASAAQIVIRGFAPTGSPVGRQVSMTLGPGVQYRAEAGGALGINASTITTGTLTIDSDVSGIVADIAIGDSQSPVLRQMSLSLSAAPSKSLVIPLTADGNGVTTTIYAANTGSAKATVQVKVAGSTAAGTTLTIPASGYVAQSVRTNGAILIDSDQPLTAVGILSVNAPSGDTAAVAAQPR